MGHESPARSRYRWLMAMALTGALTACAGSLGERATPAGSTQSTAGQAGEPAPSTAPSPTQPADPFASLPYRLDLPPGWVTLGSGAYDTRLDAGDDMQAWRTGLGLDGQYAFRAYEPREGGIGLLLAVNPQRTWNPSPLQEEGSIRALPGVRGTITSDVVATGSDWKAFGYRWSESLDWGNGSPSVRDCVGYFVMVDPNPVNAVLCAPAGEDRAAAMDAIVSTFRMTGTPVFSPVPGETPTPAPTPFDKFSGATPVPFHGATALEALLPDSLGDLPVEKESMTGVEAGMAYGSQLLDLLGKQPSDYTTAQGIVRPREQRPPAMFTVERVEGVTGEDLLAALVATASGVNASQASQVSLGGRDVTRIEVGGDIAYWLSASGDLVFGAIAEEAMAEEFFRSLP